MTSTLGRMAKAMLLQENKDTISQVILTEIQRQATEEFNAYFQPLPCPVPRVVYEGTLDVEALTHRLIDALVHLI